MIPTYQIGILAEWLCILRLWLTGWRILNRRWKHFAGEIDIIACRSNKLAFIEVKTRPTTEQAITAIHNTQQKRITKAATAWIRQHPEYAGFYQSFDIMWVTVWPWPRRLCNAWQATADR